jgi:aryl-alcohol dehydrogenase-like predicted oxidoreductase
MSHEMPQRQLGKNGPKVSAIGFGAMGLSAFYGTPASDEERFKVFDRAIELGSTYFDSADGYGDNEELLGKYFKKYPQQRQKVFLATKFAGITNPDGSYTVRGDAAHVRQAIEKSLSHLQLPYVDLYYVHRIDPKVPIEETMTALKELVQQGKIKYIGLSECSSDTIRRAHAVHPVSAVQIEYSPFSLDIERDEIGVLKTCRQLGIAIVCYSPLGRGILTGKYQSPDDFEPNDTRRFFPRFSKENFPKNLQLVEIFRKLAEQKGCTSGQLSLAWILAQGEDFIIIPGTTKISNLEENVGAVEVKLTKEEVQQLRKACENADTVGDRYPEVFSFCLFGDSAPLKT